MGTIARLFGFNWTAAAALRKASLCLPMVVAVEGAASTEPCAETEIAFQEYLLAEGLVERDANNTLILHTSNGSVPYEEAFGEANRQRSIARLYVRLVGGAISRGASSDFGKRPEDLQLARLGLLADELITCWGPMDEDHRVRALGLRASFMNDAFRKEIRVAFDEVLQRHEAAEIANTPPSAEACARGREVLRRAMIAEERFDEDELEAALSDPALARYVQRSYMMAAMVFRDVTDASDTVPDEVMPALFVLAADIVLPCMVAEGSASKDDLMIFYDVVSADERRRLVALSTDVVALHGDGGAEDQ